MSMLHLLTLLATVLADVTHCFVLPTHSKAYSPEIGASNVLPPPFDRWSNNGANMDTFSLSESSGPFQPNDRSVYDPGVDNIPMSAILGDRLNNDDADLPIIGAGPADATNDAPETEVQSELLRQLREHIREDEDIAVKSKILLKILEGSDASVPMPLVYVEEEPDDEAPEPFDVSAKSEKRSGRYYRRYPWKRQNTRYRTYESEQRYLCVPSRNDVLKLLIGLDEGRKGNHGRTVNFCNRKRPAKAIFSNIRFLG